LQNIIFICPEYKFKKPGLEIKMNKLYNLVNWVTSFCKKKKLDREDEFLPACARGDIPKIRKLQSLFVVDLNQGLSEAVQNGQEQTVFYLIKQGAKNLDENLKYACANNKYSLAELLVQSGARIIVGLRVAKSPNIIKMLHRYEQNSELIN